MPDKEDYDMIGNDNQLPFCRLDENGDASIAGTAQDMARMACALLYALYDQCEWPTDLAHQYMVAITNAMTDGCAWRKPNSKDVASGMQALGRIAHDLGEIVREDAEELWGEDDE